ncbi:MAG: DnaJ C-terminal domain-containing protein [Hyphomonadaceae bacterium]|nr:DnaJ C-terminal domain-containing protein [Hyphomonadaceae bacterium]
MSWDPYAALGVARTATQDEIRSAYRKLAKELHPDVRPNDRSADERFKRATAAFNLLSDSALKARFDRGEIDADGNEKPAFGYRGGPGAAHARGYSSTTAESAFDLGDIFSDLFGSAGGTRPNFGKMRGRDIRLPLDVDFVDAIRGGRKRVQLSDGRTLDVAIPPGVTEGQVLRLKSQGGPGVQGGPPGDALVELRIKPHAFFRREGDDVHMDLQISITEAVEGAKIQVPTVSGPVTLTIPEGANTGKVLRLKGRGVGERGDQFVRLMVMLPDNPDEDLKKFIRKWSRRDYPTHRPPA